MWEYLCPDDDGGPRLFGIAAKMLVVVRMLVVRVLFAVVRVSPPPVYPIIVGVGEGTCLSQRYKHPGGHGTLGYTRRKRVGKLSSSSKQLSEQHTVGRHAGDAVCDGLPTPRGEIEPA
jgi:hypothetical protein